MATAFTPPEGYDFEYDFFNYNQQSYYNAIKRYMSRLRKFCKDNTDSKSPLVGKVIRTPRGDGYAEYMVYRTRPLQLLHVPTGDAWHADPCWIRGLRLSDVKDMIERDKKLDELFKQKS